MEMTPTDPHGLSPKGLTAGTVGLWSAVIIGISCVAPAYSLTASLGQIVSKSGFQTPVVILAGFIPMLLVAFGYRELNRAMPDSGTAFTWTTRAFGPWIGWLAGWGLLASYVLVLSNTAGIAVDFFYLMLSEVLHGPTIRSLADNATVNIATCVAFMAIATTISYRGMEATKTFQIVLVVYQVIILIMFSLFAFFKVHNGSAFDPVAVHLSWFNPWSIPSFRDLAAGVSLSIFIFWGWDVVLTMNEETEHARTTPGRAATLTVIITVLLFLLASSASMSFAGLGHGMFGLENPEIQRNVFLGLAQPVLGGLAILMSIGVLASSAASLQSTMVSPSRTFLAMGHYHALPKRLAAINPQHGTPGFAILTSTLLSTVFYAGMRLLSAHILQDTISALGIMICFYYSMTAFAAVWYFRRQWFTSISNFFFQFAFPLVGGLMLGALFFVTMFDSLDPAFGSGTAVLGVGLVFILGMGIIVSGLVLMSAMAFIRPGFFRGETLPIGISDGQQDPGLDSLPL